MRGGRERRMPTTCITLSLIVFSKGKVARSYFRLGPSTSPQA
ncbi:hypothetical protein J007_04116 [Cryptococcus neoformans]|nr:hypothetical protein J007_04116 [Cryptococcus neoformans var. grubii]